MAKEQIIKKYLEDADEALARYKQLLNKNDLDSEEMNELSTITRKFGNLRRFLKAKDDNYDRRANSGWGGFGSPDCSCHIAPPCSNCIAWTNYCSEREFLSGKKDEPGCIIVGHDCEVSRNPA